MNLVSFSTIFDIYNLFFEFVIFVIARKLIKHAANTSNKKKGKESSTSADNSVLSQDSAEDLQLVDSNANNANSNTRTPIIKSTKMYKLKAKKSNSTKKKKSK